MGKHEAVAGMFLGALLLAGCTAGAPTVETTPPMPAAEAAESPTSSNDEWQRFRDDPKEAFIFASAYEMIFGSPIGNGETADVTVSLVHDLCMGVENGQTWDSLQEMFDAQEADAADTENYILLAQVYCPDVK